MLLEDVKRGVFLVNLERELYNFELQGDFKLKLLLVKYSKRGLQLNK